MLEIRQISDTSDKYILFRYHIYHPFKSPQNIKTAD